MNFESFIGIDVSKKTLDLCLITLDGEVESITLANDVESLSKSFDVLIEKFELNMVKVLVCAEYTGHYTNPVRVFCLDQGYNLWLESGAEIKLISGVQRGKNDQVDARRIADYALRYGDNAQLQKMENKALEEASFLSSERDMYIRERAKYKAQIKDLKGYINPKLYQARKTRFQKHIRYLTVPINRLEKQIEALITSSETLAQQYAILKSIQGIGQKTAVETIIATKGFIKFDTGRKFCCHIGVAPFYYASGTSQRSRNKVSHRANKKLKTLFHMAALSAITMEGEFKTYFERKVMEGKNKMTVLNAIRAKLVLRIFALVRDNRHYEFSYTHPLA